MSRKRVHELAKEFGLDNREAVELLQKAGFEVKSHSSTVDETEGRAALGGSSGAKAEEPKKKKRAGMMIVRKKTKAAEEGADTAAPVEAEAQASSETPEVSPTVEAAPAEVVQPEVVEPTPEPTAEVTTSSEGEPEEVAAPPSEEGEPPAAPGEAPAEGASTGPAIPEGLKRRPGGAPVVRMIDRSKLMERIPSRRLGGGGPGGPGGSRGPQRPGGPSGAGPAGGNQQRLGRVTELKVVNDPFGRGREMVDVGKDRRGAPGRGGPAGKNKRRSGGRRQMSDMRERAMGPTRLRKKRTGKKAGDRLVDSVHQPKDSKLVIKMKETIVVAELAHQLGAKSGEVVRALMALDMMVSQNEAVDFDTAQIVAQEFGYKVESVAFEEDTVLEAAPEETEAEENLEPRPPVVTVMGHVDHGKTSLLDAIRKTRVASGEAGGITQHIGAYQVDLPKKGVVTFLDTPGHAAFTQMRARGANSTDIVVLVVAADDGVMPQTEEAVRHAQAAGVPIVVAVNKMDKPDANPDRVTQELAKFELMPEDWGGDTMFIQTSATAGTGIDELLEALLLQAEVLELKANKERRAVGTVVEAKLDKGRGAVATLLVQKGTLRRGDAVVVGECHGKVRAMMDAQGRQLKEAGPSTPVEITGLDGVPGAGDQLNGVETTDDARRVAEHRAEQRKAGEQNASRRMSLDEFMVHMGEGPAAVKELNLVFKADVQGTCEAVREALDKLSTDEVKVKVIFNAVGGIKESDIMLAAASQGIVLGFNVRPDANARTIAEREGVEIRTYRVIYEMVDDVRKAMEGLLSPESREKIVGRCEVRDTFKISKVGTIAGCRVVEGKARRSAKIRVLRDSVQVYEGTVSSLKHYKEDAREVDNGQECGVAVEGFNDLKPGDALEFFEVEEIARTLEASAAASRPPSVSAHP